MSQSHPDLQTISRVVFSHAWTDVNEWARSIAALAELNDEELGTLPTLAANQAKPGHSGPWAAPTKC
ncbi:MAG: hypothetical protein WAS73_06510 [Defluviicoccus sp.]